jgi:hypothetical protein
MTYLELINDCWSRSFKHPEYLLYAGAMKKAGHVVPHLVSAPAYKLICDGLTLDMEQNIGVEQPFDPLNPEAQYPNGLMF